ncbi:hypothetical protein NLG97_g1248 [Lecanicillium saksenae]|uniref:Uncharacterized protein n=1 Tax=Lecanicillium saksenae TaxID=468837 RepID=A0ACC1R607_9HYPO|nr:hypothetical protein NLG97_g1248 [Lecanicillium saksenae]
MFKFDQVALPKLLLRKALIIVDFQQDFVGDNATSPITLPDGYVDRTVRLAKAFRQIGDVIWVNSRFEEVRPLLDQHLEHPTNGQSSSQDATTDPDAFLSHESAKCVLSSKIGSEVPQFVKDFAETKDAFLFKSHYSAFEGTSLLRRLRAKMTMEVYICGSLINTGVYATTVDAAGHGLNITLVNDCCGYSDEARQIRAIKTLRALTGCNLMLSAEVAQEDSQKSNEFGAGSVEIHHSHASPVDDIALPMSALTLNVTAPRAAEGGSLQGTRQKCLTEENRSGWKLRTDKADVGEAGETKEDNVYKQDDAPAGGLQEDTNNTIHSYVSTMDTSTQPSDASAQQDDHQLRGLCEGDTDVIENLLPPELENGIFDKLKEEVQWQRMSHQGGEVPRLVAVQGEVGNDGSIPIYRHPSDESPPLLPFSPTVLEIKAVTEKQLGHPLNHVLIQFYRDGKDYISEHSDKTLDIVRGSYIANVSLGAKRTMVLRTKRADKDPSNIDQPTSGGGRQVQRAPLPHNSLCRMGLNTNMKWLHSIRQDKRSDREKSPEELAYEGGRISLTFRQIGTFLNKDETKIWGQGATAKTLGGAKDVINGQTEASIRMLRAFGTENHASNFDWEAYYGQGFDVLHLRSAPRFFTSADSIVNMRISLMLAEYEIGYASGSITQSKKSPSQDTSTTGATDDALIKYVDNDDDKTEVSGDIAIMFYLHSNHQKKKSTMTPGELAKQYTLFQKSLSFLRKWRELLKRHDRNETLITAVKDELAPWQTCTSGGEYIGGDRPNLADFAFWPILHSIVEKCGKDALAESKDLSDYYETLKTRPSTVKILDRMQQTD